VPAATAEAIVGTGGGGGATGGALTGRPAVGLGGRFDGVRDGVDVGGGGRSEIMIFGR
jgi:hypothetical protein